MNTPFAFLLPPAAGGPARHPPLDLARQGQGGAAHFFEALLRLDAHVDVDPPRARGLREALEGVLLQHLAHDQRHLADLVEGDPRAGVEVHPQLVGVVEVRAAHRPGIPVDHPEVHAPQQVGPVVGDQLAGVAPAGEGHGGGLQPLRRALGHPLLEERLPAHAVHPPLQDGGAVAQAAHDRVLALDVVVGEVELRQAGLGEEHLARVAQANLAAAGAQHDALTLLRGHRLKGCRMCGRTCACCS